MSKKQFRQKMIKQAAGLLRYSPSTDRADFPRVPAYYRKSVEKYHERARLAAITLRDAHDRLQDAEATIKELEAEVKEAFYDGRDARERAEKAGDELHELTARVKWAYAALDEYPEHMDVGDEIGSVR